MRDKVADDLADALDINKLAQSVLKISAGMDLLLHEPGGLTSDAIVLLLHDKTGVGKKTITTILKALPQLHKHYCRGIKT